MEDNLAAHRNSYLQAKSGPGGKFTVPKVPKGNFFQYVEPADTHYLPGGDQSRKALSTKELTKTAVTVKVSGNTPTDASYVGTTKCLKCREEQEHFTQTLHRLGIRVIGDDSKHQDWLFKEESKKLTDPPAKKSFERECAACHYAGFTLTETPEGKFIAGSVNDKNGELDIDGDGIPNELNMGCETCHGPGSAHAEDEASVSIVNPGKLASERASTICVQCHSRPQGHLGNDSPVDVANRMMSPGTSGNTFLTQFTSREDAAEKDFWPDGIHSKAHHQQGSDFIKTSKYRNDRHLVACYDCHDPHGEAEFAHQRTAALDSTKACNQCHEKQTDMKKHVKETTKCTVAPDKIACTSCHNTKTMQTGAGMGKGLVGRDGKNYWMNDITSHLYDVPRKDNVGVKGVPGHSSD